MRRSAGLVARLRTPAGTKLVRYLLASGISVLVGQSVLFVAYGVLSLASATVCNFVACWIAAVPSYYLNRAWVWGRTGRSHLMREIVPFWGIALAGLAVSMVAVASVEAWARSARWSHLATASAVNAAALAAVGVVWVGKFVLLERVLFARRPAAPERELS